MKIYIALNDLQTKTLLLEVSHAHMRLALHALVNVAATAAIQYWNYGSLISTGHRIGLVFIRLFCRRCCCSNICLLCLCTRRVCCFWWALVCNWIAFTTSLSTIISNRRVNICCYPITNPTLTLIDAAINWFYFQFDLTTCSLAYLRVYVSYRLAGAIFIAACTLQTTCVFVQKRRGSFRLLLLLLSTGSYFQMVRDWMSLSHTLEKNAPRNLAASKHCTVSYWIMQCCVG